MPLFIGFGATKRRELTVSPAATPSVVGEQCRRRGQSRKRSAWRIRKCVVSGAAKAPCVPIETLPGRHKDKGRRAERHDRSRRGPIGQSWRSRRVTDSQKM